MTSISVGKQILRVPFVSCFLTALILTGTAAQSQDDRTARAPQQAQAPKAQAPQAPPWVVSCNNINPASELRCRTEQVLSVTQTRQRLVSVAFDRNAQGIVVGRIALPHGILFSAGIQLWVDDGTKRKLSVNSADENGSYADVPVTADLMKEMKSGSTLRIQAKTLSQDDLVMELTLNGFGNSVKFVEKNPS